MTVARVRFKRTDLELSQFIAGCWRLMQWNRSREELDTWIRTCISFGVTSFDLADVYGDGQCEGLFGQALDHKLRDQIQLVTKCGICPPNVNPEFRVKHYDTSAQHIIASVEKSLEALGTDRLDLVLLHRPDPLLHAEEVADAFHRLATSGKVRFFGVSNFTPRQVELLATSASRPLVTNQIQVSLGHLDPLYDGTLDQLQRLDMQPMAWSPLGGGAIAASREPRWQRIHQALDKLAISRSATREQMALAWLLRHPSGILPILGTGNLERMQSQVQAGQIELDRQDWFELLEASTGSPVP